MKRFYREVTVDLGELGYRILLDGRPMRTPAKQALAVPTARLAEALADEWREQRDRIRPDTMPLTRLASTAIDRMPAQRQAAIEEVIGYADTDLVCYRAAEPFELVQRQHHAWQPMVEWLSQTYGVRLVVTTSILPLVQPPAARAALRGAIEKLDDWPLVGMHAATTALGSLVLGLGLLRGRLDAEAALAASLLDELYEIERWGSDVEAERRHQALRRDISGAARFLAGLHQLERPEANDPRTLSGNPATAKGHGST
jgi:chaperone required for assembly of F1-ATPase